MNQKTTILGSGAMATACAVVLADHPGQTVSLWSHDAEHAREIMTDRENRRLLPGVPLPDTITATGDIAEAADGIDVLLVAIPTRFLRNTLERLAPALQGSFPVVSVVKGMENDTFLRPSEIIEDILGSRAVCTLGGPSHAEEISRRLPTSMVAASGDVAFARSVQQMFSTDRLRVYTNQDLIGVELAAALKNVIAIAAGICDGLGFGDNAKSALMTRGNVEISRFGIEFGAEPATFQGLAGIGDLITTCISPHGRNRSVGEALGKGRTLDEIVRGTDSVAEGINTTASVYKLAGQRGIEMPITEGVHSVLFGGKSVMEATIDLLNRPTGEE